MTETREELSRAAVWYVCDHPEIPRNQESAVTRAFEAGAAWEREACAVEAEARHNLDMTGGSTGNAKGTAKGIAAAIRARGERT